MNELAVMRTVAPADRTWRHGHASFNVIVTLTRFSVNTSGWQIVCLDVAITATCVSDHVR